MSSFSIFAFALRNSANAATMARIFLASIINYFAFFRADHPFAREIMFACLFGAMLSDKLDGWLARRYGVTAFGAMIDPVADKYLVISISLILWNWLPPEVDDWLKSSLNAAIIVLVSLELILFFSGIVIRLLKIIPHSNKWGKMKMTVECVGVSGWFVFQEMFGVKSGPPLIVANILLFLAAALTILSLVGHFKTLKVR